MAKAGRCQLVQNKKIKTIFFPAEHFGPLSCLSFREGSKTLREGRGLMMVSRKFSKPSTKCLKYPNHFKASLQSNIVKKVSMFFFQI